MHRRISAYIYIYVFRENRLISKACISPNVQHTGLCNHIPHRRSPP